MLRNPNMSLPPSFILGESSADRPKSRRRKLNYNTQDITILLDLVSALTPTGTNMCKLLESEYNKWTPQSELPGREYDSLKEEFQKMVNAKKTTGNPRCPDDIWREKNS